MTVADKLATWLAERGITHAFGVVGAGNLAIWDAITRLEKTRIVCVHHEQAAATAAAAFNRISGRLGGICLVTSGGGSANTLTGVLGAYGDSIPLLVISGNEPMQYLSADTRILGVQGLDSVAAALGFTKEAIRLSKWDEDIMESMYRCATHPRCGPVWIDIPRDVQNA